MLAGCASHPPLARSQLQQQALTNVAVPPVWRAGSTAGALQSSAWLDSFGDPALKPLVEEALVYNADLQLATTRVEQAVAALQMARAPLLPSVAIPGVYSGKAGGQGGLNALFLSASLELDVWGRLRHGAQAAQAQADAALADQAFARQSLAATVVKGWYLAIEAGLQGRLLADSLQAANELQRLAQERRRVGAGDDLAVADGAARVAELRDRQQQVSQSRDEALRGLEMLLGRYPAADLAVAGQLAPMPAAAPAGLPSDLLERRPDVIAAERRVAAAFHRVGEAKAARLPRLSLSANLGTISSDLLLLQSRSNPSAGLGADLFAPLIQGGALQAQVALRDAEQAQAMADYARVARRSFGDVENALGAENSLALREALLTSSVAENQRALNLAQVQYRVGKVDQRSVQQRQLELFSARAALLRAQTDRLVQRANLFLALGGSFDGATTLAAQSAPSARQ
jgi:NodT family efflux transporter outer membrane factor (OMF) lipoprotein